MGDDIAGAHDVADIDHPGDDLAGDAEAEIGLVARPHDADEFARGLSVLERDALHLDRALRPRCRGGNGLAPGQQDCGGKQGERLRQDPERHRTLLITNL